MRRWLPALVAFVVCLTNSGFAQDSESADAAPVREESTPPDAPGGAAPPPVRDESGPPPAPLKGDIIRLKSGKILSDVQVLRRTPVHFEIQVHEGLEPLIIPRKQVESVEYDDIDPNRQRHAPETLPAGTQPELMPGKKLSPEMYIRFTSPIKEQMSIENRDFIQVLNEISTKTGVKLEIAQELAQWRRRDRLWTTEIGPETSLQMLLADDLEKKFSVKIDYTLDTILIEPRGEAPAAGAEETPSSATPEN